MSATETNPDLKQLSLRAQLAYTVRCVRRVQPLYKVPAQLPAAAACVTAIGKALELIEQFAAGEEVGLKTVSRIEEATVCALMVVGQSKTGDPVAAYVANAAYAATCALKAAIECQNSPDPLQTAENAAESALIAVDAALSADPQIASAAKLDWEMIHRMRLGNFPELGKTIDPSESGILGRLRCSPNTNSNTAKRSSSSPNIDSQAFADAPDEGQFDTDQNDISDTPAITDSPNTADPEQLRKLEMLAAMIRTKQKELLVERDAFEAEKQAFEQEQADWESHKKNQQAQGAATVAIPVDLTTEQAKFLKEREKFETDRKAMEAERAELHRERSDLLQQESDLHKELRKLQEERKKNAPKEDALRALSRQQAAQSSPVQVQQLLSQLQEERHRLKAEKEQLAEVLALVTSGRLSPATGKKKRKAHRGTDANIPRLRMILEPGDATQAQMTDLFRELAALYTDLGGPGLQFSVEDARLWSVAKMARRQRTDSDLERSFVEVHLIDRSDSADELNLAVWGRFASSLFMALRLDAGLANYFKLSEELGNDHKVWKLAADSAARASGNGSRGSNSAIQAGSGGLFIDALNSRMQQIQELRRSLECTTGLMLELLPEHDEDEVDEERPARTANSSFHPSAQVAQQTTSHKESTSIDKQPAARRSPNRSKLLAISLAAVGAAILVAVLCLK